jgi:hypothetical protein
MPKTISEDDRLKAFALAYAANDFYRQACQLDMTMQRLLGMEAKYYGGGQIGDAIYDDKPLNLAIFDEALKGDEYTVAAPGG